MSRHRRENQPPALPPGDSEETRRARQAAREAAIQLDQVRAQRSQVDRSQRELDDLNQHNGFYMLIRNAFGV